MDLSSQQKSALDCIVDWWNDGSRTCDSEFRLGGFAGTGKTTLLAESRKILLKMHAFNVAYVCYTGKAATILSKKLKSAKALRHQDYCGTIHGLIYHPKIDPVTKQIIGWAKKSAKDMNHFNLIAIDEASMVDEHIYNDLKSYGIPMLIFGDHFQLPPISGKLNLMEELNFKLTEIHRQAKDNPIIEISMMLRNFETIPFKQFGNGVAKVCKHVHKPIINDFIKNTKTWINTMILCGFNNTRCSMNETVRRHFGFDELNPMSGDRVICLRNNWQATPMPLANGMLGKVIECKEFDDHFDMEVLFDDEKCTFLGSFDKDTFLNPKPEVTRKTVQKYMITPDGKEESLLEVQMNFLDFGYCLTVHKAQGSQAQRVMLIEEHSKYWTEEQYFRWLYTGITRAEKQLLIVGDGR